MDIPNLFSNLICRFGYPGKKTKKQDLLAEVLLR